MHIHIRSREYHRNIRNLSNYPPFGSDANFGNYLDAADVIVRYNRSRKITSSKYNIFATSPWSRSASIRVHVEVPTDKEGRGALEPPPEDSTRWSSPPKTFTCSIRSSPADVKQNQNERSGPADVKSKTNAREYATAKF